MKTKFLSAVLLGGFLAASTGTFVSCKDYDDDITDLQKQIDALVSPETLNTQISALQAQITAAQSSAASDLANAKTALEAAIAAKADASTITDLQNKVAEAEKKAKEVEDQLSPLSTQLDALQEKVADLEKQISNASSSSSANASDVQAALKKTQEEIAAELEQVKAELTSLLGDNLQSLVFIPQLYLDGIEATRYQFATGTYQELKGDATGESSEGVEFKIASQNAPEDVKDGAFSLGKQNTASYHINPTSAAIANVAWDILYSAPEFVKTRAAEPAFNVVKAEKDAKADGDIVVTYTIDNADALKIGGEENVSVFALRGTYKKTGEANDTTVTSDYAAILPQEISLKNIAFTAIETKEETGCETKRDLYLKGENAAKNEASWEVQYNKGAQSLSKLLEVHYTATDLTSDEVEESKEIKILTPAEVAAYGLHFEYELLDYVTGTNGTKEQAYATIDANGNFTPCYVDAQGKTVACGTDKTGISAVGRTPIVIVKLMADKKVVLAGYVKVKIAEVAASPETKELDVVKTFSEPYVCSATETITWDEMSGKILEALGVTKETFTANYTLDETGFYTKTTKDGEDTYTVTTAYGTIANKADKGTTTNDVFTWTANLSQIEAISKLAGSKVTLYAKYENKIGGIVYVPVEISVLEQPGAEFAKKIDSYWYPASKELAKRDTVRVNVPAPVTGGDVTKYEKNLNEYFVGQAVEVSFTGATAAKYAGQTISYKYQFAAKQPATAAGYTLSTPTTGENAYTVLQATKKGVEPTTVATLDTATGKLTYENNPVAKELLNAYGHLVPNYFAVVEIVASYGDGEDCSIDFGTESFNARFLRPVDVLDGDNAEFLDAQANGSSIVLGDLFGLKDWREKAIVTKVDGKYAAATDNGVDLFAYYQISEVAIDLANAETDASGERMTIAKLSGTDKDSSKELIIKLSVENGVDALTAKNGVVTVSLNSNAAVLNDYTVTYKNNAGNTKDFNIWIPVKVTYSWGTVEAWAKVKVNNTLAN